MTNSRRNSLLVEYFLASRNRIYGEREEYFFQLTMGRVVCHRGFRMDALDYFVMVKGDLETDLLFIVHRDTHLSPETGLGDAFFCTSLGASDQSYDLKAKLCSHSGLCYSMVGACAVNLVDHWKDIFVRDFLCLSRFPSGVNQIMPIEIRFRLQVDSEDDDEEEEVD